MQGHTQKCNPRGRRDRQNQKPKTDARHRHYFFFTIDKQNQYYPIETASGAMVIPASLWAGKNVCLPEYTKVTTSYTTVTICVVLVMLEVFECRAMSLPYGLEIWLEFLRNTRVIVFLTTIGTGWIPAHTYNRYKDTRLTLLLSNNIIVIGT